MANTIKLGNGNWATKEGSLLAYNDERNNFKPLPFTTTRASSATVVNKQGLIETVGSGIPRIDFSDDSDGALLLENSATNLIPYSEALNISYAPTNMTQTSDYGTSPDGSLTSTRLVLDNLTDSRSFNNTSLVNGTEYTFSAYYKGVSGEKTYMYFLSSTGGTTLSKEITFNGNWQRESITFTAGSVSNYTYIVDVRQGASTATDFEVWGASLEENSYSTSYIKTVGTTQTRVADTCSQTPASGIIGQTEGVVFADFVINGNAFPYTNIINANKNTTSSFSMIKNNSINKIEASVWADADTTISSLSTYSNGQRLKVALLYKSGKILLYVNGILEASSTNTFLFSQSITELFLSDNVTYFGYQEDLSFNEVKLYNTELTNAELQSLTTI